MRSGPGMNPALVDQCGWLDVSSPRVAVIDTVTLGGHAAAVARGSAHRRAGRLRCRDPRRTGAGWWTALRMHPEGEGWDRGFESQFLTTPLGQPLKQLCVYPSTPPATACSSGAALRPLVPPLVLGRVPLRVTVVASNPEGPSIRFDESPGAALTRWRASNAIRPPRSRWQRGVSPPTLTSSTARARSATTISTATAGSTSRGR